MAQLMAQQGLANDTTDGEAEVLAIEICRVDIRYTQAQIVGVATRVYYRGPITAV